MYPLYPPVPPPMHVHCTCVSANYSLQLTELRGDDAFTVQGRCRQIHHLLALTDVLPQGVAYNLW